MSLIVLKQYLVCFEDKVKFCNGFDFFGLKIKYIKKTMNNLNHMDNRGCQDYINYIYNIDRWNEINLFEIQYKDKLINNEVGDGDSLDYIIVKDRNRYIFNLLVNLCMRKGNKDLAYRNVKKSFVLLRKFFWLNAMLFIRLILVQSESLFIIQKYSIGKREKVIPRFIPFEKKTKFVLRMLVKHARFNQKDYKYFYISLANAIIEYSLPNNILMDKNREDNQLAESNKFFLIKKKKRKRKMRLFRKIDHWKE